MTREVGALLIDVQVIGVGRLIDGIDLMHLGQQAGAGLEAGIERQVRSFEASPAREAALAARDPMGET